MEIRTQIDLRCGDCLELMKDIPDGSVDLILCDLPYGRTQNHWDKAIPFEPLWEQYERIIKPNGCIALFSQPPFDKALGASNPKMLRYEWIWEKSRATNHLNSKKMPMRAHENILIFYKKAPTYNPQGLKRKEHPTIRKGGKGNGTNYGKSDKDSLQEFENYPTDIIKFASIGNCKHSTQKPVPLLEYLIKTYTNPGDVVLDNCMGSGSTGVACINTGRSFIGIELEQDFFNVAIDRIAKAQAAL